MLEHAPITGTLLAASALTGVLTRSLLEGRAVEAAQLVGAKLPLGATPAAATALAQRLAAVVPSLGLRLVGQTLPCGLGSTLSIFDALCALAALSHLRLLERRWGSASALSFSLVCSLTGTVLVELIGTLTAPPPGILASSVSSSSSSSPLSTASASAAGTRVLPGGLTRLLSGNALLVPLTAILIRLLCEYPPRSDNDVLRRVPLPAALTRWLPVCTTTTSSATTTRTEDDDASSPPQAPALTITKTTVVMLMLVLKLTLIPEMLFTLTPSSSSSAAGTASTAATARRPMYVLVDLGLATRLLLFVAGVVLGLWSAVPSSALNRLCLAPLREWLCRPLVRLTRPIWQLAFGASHTVTHQSPPYMKAREAQAEAAQQWERAGFRAGGGGSTVLDGGRVTVQSLAHDGGGAAAGLRRRGPAPREAAHQPTPTPTTTITTPSAAGAAPVQRAGDLFHVDETAVAQIQQLGLPVLEAEVRGALAATRGDVNEAVQLLLGSI